MAPASKLKEQVMIPIVDDAASGPRAQLVYAPSEYVRLVPYAFSYLRYVLYAVLMVCSCGLLLVISVWFPQVFTHLTRIRLPQSCLGDAQYMLVQIHEDGIRSNWVEVKVHRITKQRKTNAAAATAKAKKLNKRLGSCAELPWVWFEFKKHRYVFNHERGEYERFLATVKEDLGDIQKRLETGLSDALVADKAEVYGRNVVDIDAPSIPMMLFTKVVHPYYLFQVFSATVWFCQGYTIYAIIILVLSAISMAWEIYSEVSNNKKLRALVQSDREIRVVRTAAATAEPVNAEPAGSAPPIHESALVPGDIVQLTLGAVVADVLLLSGSCVVDEASLTGEAVPINKAAVCDRSGTITEADARTRYKTSFVQAGTTITRVRDASGPCKGVVLSTGFSTGKGELFRSILFPRELTFEFEQDSYRYLAVLAAIAVAAFVKRIVNFAHDGYGFGYTIVNSLDLITIAVPPALPLVLSSGIGFALERLRKRGIFCIDAQRINSCGQLDTFCFDKTGTLTEDSMRLVAYDAFKHGAFERIRMDSLSDKVRLAMATCHSLSHLDGVTQGSPLEMALYNLAYLERVEMGHDTHVFKSPSGDYFGVLKQFPFDAERQTSSVVLENLETKQRLVFVKGSPEAVHALAVHKSPAFMQQALRYSAEGNYCIAFGVRVLAESKVVDLDDRAAVEKRTHPMGIALFHNELKPQSRAVLEELYAAAIDVRIITGDNALTAVHVARLLSMDLKPHVAIVDANQSADIVFASVDALASADTDQWELLTSANLARVLAAYDLALTGKALEQLKLELSDESLKRLLLATRIFARISPTQKSWIVERLMDYGKIVGMCGDGTNDCGALKAAHVGLALSSAEASIVAPFTSKEKEVADVPVLIREGRCALTTSFLGFKFMVLYPVIQLGMASTLGHFGTMLSNNQYLWDDMGIVLGLAITMLYTASSDKLTKEKPPHTLFSLTIVASIVGQIALFIAFFAGTFVLLNAQSWFCRRADGMALVTAYLADPASVATTPSLVQSLENCGFNMAFLDDVSESVDDIPVSFEGSTVWLFGHMQYFGVALAFNLTDRFRQPMYTNYTFVALFLTSLGVNLWFLLDTSGTIDGTFQTLGLPASFRWAMLGMFLGHFAAAQAWELVATRALPAWCVRRRETRDAEKRGSRVQRSDSMAVEMAIAAAEMVEVVVDKEENEAMEKQGEKDKADGHVREGELVELMETPKSDVEQQGDGELAEDATADEAENATPADEEAEEAEEDRGEDQDEDEAGSQHSDEGDRKLKKKKKREEEEEEEEQEENRSECEESMDVSTTRIVVESECEYEIETKTSEVEGDAGVAAAAEENNTDEAEDSESTQDDSTSSSEASLGSEETPNEGDEERESGERHESGDDHSPGEPDAGEPVVDVAAAAGATEATRATEPTSPSETAKSLFSRVWS